jgi:hypothetical protein
MLKESETETIADPVVTLETVPAAALETYLKRIQASWQKRTSSIFAVAEACNEANKQLSGKAKKKLHEALPFSKATFVKLAQIGGDERLPPIAQKLPASFSIIYEITLLSDEEFEHAVMSDTIHPKVRRNQIIELRKKEEKAGHGGDKGRNDQPALAPKVEAGKLYQLNMPDNVGEKECGRIGEVLGKLIAKFHIKVGPAEAAEV